MSILFATASLYCLLPIGLFMVLMSFRTKNHKTTALTAFTNENSEFQHIFPNFILVTVEPNFIKRQIQKKIQHINSFIQKYFLMFLVLLFLAVIIIAITYYLMHFIF